MSYYIGKRVGKIPSYDQFGTYDYVVVGIVLAISAGIGLYYRLTGGKQQTVDEYLLASRSMGALPVAFSLMASFMSAITLLGVSMEMYQYGTQFVVINLAYVLATPIVTHYILPVFYRLKTASVFEYLETRFGYSTRLIASLVFTIQMTLYMGIVLYAPALALQVVSGINLTLSISVLGIVCTFYATLGGMKAVLVTDVFQSLLMFATIFSVIIVSIIKAENIMLIWETAAVGGRLEFDNFSLDPTVRHTWFTQIIGGIATYLSIYGVNQTQVQRLLSTRSLRSARLALWWNLPILISLSLATCFAGLCLYYYYEHCDPLLDDRITSRDQLLPMFIMDTMGHLPGLAGLCVAGIFSGSLSTISSAISSLTAVTLEDYVKPLLRKCDYKVMSDFRTSLYSKIISLCYGAICIMLAFLASTLGGLLQASLSILGIVGGPMLGIFTLGMCGKMANERGAIFGLLSGLAFTSWLGFGGPKPTEPILSVSMDMCYFNETRYEIFVRGEQKLQYGIHFGRESYQSYFEEFFYLYRISYMWYAVIGFLITFFTGIIGSILFSFCNCQGACKRQVTNNNLSLSKDVEPNISVKSYTLNDTISSSNTYGDTFRSTNNDSDYYNESFIDDDDNDSIACSTSTQSKRRANAKNQNRLPPIRNNLNNLNKQIIHNNRSVNITHGMDEKPSAKISPMYTGVDDEWDSNTNYSIQAPSTAIPNPRISVHNQPNFCKITQITTK